MYQMNEGTLTLPAQWRDESLHVFVLPDETTNLVVNRTPIEGSKTADEAYQDTLTQLSAQLKGYEERQAWTLMLDGQNAQAVEYTWQSPEGRMHQVVVMQVCGSLLLTFTITAADVLSDARKAELLAVIETFTVAAPEGKENRHA
ncbi:DUF1795 domain-containing protein [Pectobacterium parmentieri]|uniref:DUF1795 domain-containing protein n=1 Tax=Pectobacterium parmentieri TaxID=1905730 RepID=A0A8B3FXP9_PECPM|nr:DUF1795 domain-containing protein [Pectobacterium parmentieri]AOR58291.1 hypothetical protein A8F97_05155 [Pectobacterium parmentieri]AYH10697.1 DUF1795 domain-containing protein [Pectobacterium parmentieri]AYH18592.1 DUF1795 domain-containing protein [Pectobacterium parmentieri]AYH36978.1 DUF1795 domain-containing protein [Pectobacterium parmentieri]AZS57210.1 DUF1795 domain-containing protein [Pectobacterium parmentieri]